MIAFLRQNLLYWKYCIDTIAAVQKKINFWKTNWKQTALFHILTDLKVFRVILLKWRIVTLKQILSI